MNTALTLGLTPANFFVFDLYNFLVFFSKVEKITVYLALIFDDNSNFWARFSPLAEDGDDGSKGLFEMLQKKSAEGVSARSIQTPPAGTELAKVIDQQVALVVAGDKLKEQTRHVAASFKFMFDDDGNITGVRPDVSI